MLLLLPRGGGGENVLPAAGGGSRCEYVGCVPVAIWEVIGEKKKNRRRK